MNNKKTIVILGAGVMQLPALNAARRMGWKTIVADGNPEAPGRRLADIFEHIDLNEKEALAAAVRKHQANGGVDGVFTAGTDFSASVAWVAAECGLPGIPYETALDASQKQRMRHTLHRFGIPQPDFTVVDNSGNITLGRLRFPLVVKPVDNMGARGVRRVDAVPELEEAVAVAMRFSRTRTVIVEEYIAGPEFSLDALVYEGEITVCGFADRHIVFEPWFIEMGHTIPANVDAKTATAVTDVFFRAIRALGIATGAAKGDILLSENGPLVGEIAARLSGGYMSGWTFPYSSGVDLAKAGLLIASGMPPGSLVDTEHAVSAERAFISIPGIAGSLHGINDAETSRGVKNLFVRVKENDTVVFPQNNVEKCGNIISKAGTREEAVGDAMAAIRKICIRLKPNNPDTDAFLLGERLAHIRAFQPELSETGAYLSGMPPFFGSHEKISLVEISVAELPIIQKEPCTDWHGETLSDAVDRIRTLVPLRFVRVEDGDTAALGAVFWNAVFRAGVQGGLYAIDSFCDKMHWGRYILSMIQENRK